MSKSLPNAPQNERFKTHKLALRPLLKPLDQKETQALFEQLESFDLTDFITFLHRQGLAQLWLSFLQQQETLPTRFKTHAKNLKRHALQTAAGQLMQQKVLLDAANAFKGAGIEYLIFKGAQLRRTIYEDPIQRHVCDIDVLVRDEDKFNAIKALLEIGFVAHHKAENISHETSLVKSNVCIDLHWSLMRPGRTSSDLNGYLFDHQQAFGEFVGLSNEASLLVMLVHPAITKYVNGEASSLRHLIDIHRLAQARDIDWKRLIETLKQSGTRTAAWASLAWLQILAAHPVHEALTNQIRPSNLRAAWLENWIKRDLNSKFAKRRLVTRTCFSLALQDNLKDMFSAVRTLKKEKREAEKLMEKLKQLEVSSDHLEAN